MSFQEQRLRLGQARAGSCRWAWGAALSHWSEAGSLGRQFQPQRGHSPPPAPGGCSGSQSPGPGSPIWRLTTENAQFTRGTLGHLRGRTQTIPAHPDGRHPGRWQIAEPLLSFPSSRLVQDRAHKPRQVPWAPAFSISSGPQLGPRIQQACVPMVFLPAPGRVLVSSWGSAVLSLLSQFNCHNTSELSSRAWLHRGLGWGQLHSNVLGVRVRG